MSTTEAPPGNGWGLFCFPPITSGDPLFDYIEMFFNPIRRHGSAGGVSPVEFERRYALSGN